MSKQPKNTFEVKVVLPKGVTTRVMAAYIREAVRHWCGSTDYNDPLFDLDKKSVSVTHLGVVETTVRELT